MKQTRAVLLATNGFPIIFRLWMEMFKKWQDEVDALYIVISDYSVPSAKDYIRNIIKEFPKAHLLDENIRGFPNSYNNAYEASKEDTFLLMHDDALVHKKGIVDKYFKIAEEGKVTVPLHGIYEPSTIVNEAIEKKYGWTTDKAPFSFLTYFLFISRENLEKTTINFNGVGWQKGDDIPLLGIKDAPESIAGDSGFLMALELFEKQVPFHPIPRSETANLAFESEDIIPLLIEWMKNKENIFGEGWLHLQGTGTVIPLWFDIDLDARKWDLKIEEPRLAWIYEMMRTESFDEIPEFREKAQKVFDGVVLRCGADIGRIKTLADIFHILLYN